MFQTVAELHFLPPLTLEVSEQTPALILVFSLQMRLKEKQNLIGGDIGRRTSLLNGDKCVVTCSAHHCADKMFRENQLEWLLSRYVLWFSYNCKCNCWRSTLQGQALEIWIIFLVDYCTVCIEFHT